MLVYLGNNIEVTAPIQSSSVLSVSCFCVLNILVSILSVRLKMRSGSGRRSAVMVNVSGLVKDPAKGGKCIALCNAVYGMCDGAQNMPDS